MLSKKTSELSAITEIDYVKMVMELSEEYAEFFKIDKNRDWIYFMTTKNNQLPNQGWKIHISVVPYQSIELFKVIISTLKDFNVNWKIPSSFKKLKRITYGGVQIEQTGKVVTIYPSNKKVFKILMGKLHEITKMFFGPKVPTDKKYKNSNCLFYRYGAFKDLYYYDKYTGIKVPSLYNNKGELEIDNRSPGKYKPEWVEPIFIEENQEFINIGKFLLKKNIKIDKVIKQGGKGGIYLVNYKGKKAILKEGRANVVTDELGRDVRDRLKNESEILIILNDVSISPKPLDFFKMSENVYLLMEFFEGKTLRKYIEELHYISEYNDEILIQICEELFSIIQVFHEKKIIIRDLSPNNIIIDKSGLKIIDLELAHITNGNYKTFTGYTAGYVKMGEEDGERSSYKDDIYAFGALLYFISTGIDPYFKFEEYKTFFEKLNNFLNYIETPILRKIGKMGVKLMRNPDISFNIDFFNEYLVEKKSLKKFDDQCMNKELILDKALSIADYIYNIADFENKKTLWPTNGLSELFHIGNFNNGVSGSAYYYYELYEITKDKKYLYYAKDIIEWVNNNHGYETNATPPGLYFGYGAIPWILSNLGKKLKDNSLTNKAIEIANLIANDKIRQMNISHGASGIGLMLMEVFEQTGDNELLIKASEMGDLVIKNAKYQEDKIYWNAISTLKEGFKIHKPIGYSHGIAGIGYFLLSLYSLTKEEKFLKIVYEVIKTLDRTSIEIANGKAVTWAHSLDDINSTIGWTHWCNGASGVGNFLLPASQIIKNNKIIKLSEKCADAVNLSSAFGSFCQCHGLAGNGDFLINAFRFTNNQKYYETAVSNSQKLLALKYIQNNLWLWTIEDRQTFGIEYMTGYVGIYSFLLRLFYDIPLHLTFKGFK